MTTSSNMQRAMKPAAAGTVADPTKVRLIVLDVDGVLTDGSLYIDDRGIETKRFYVRDGLAIRAAMAQSIQVAVLTARSSRAVALRIAELQIPLFVQAAKDKRIGFETILQQARVEATEAAYLGDDLLDLPAMVRCGYKMAVADAADEVLQAADYVSTKRGGRGAVRQAIEHILKAQGKWDAVLEAFAE